MRRVRGEYHVHWCDEDGDSCNIDFYDGKQWREVEKIVAQCDAGEDEADCAGRTIGWIERVEHFYRREWVAQADGNGVARVGSNQTKHPGYYAWEPTDEREEETLWQREGIE